LRRGLGKSAAIAVVEETPALFGPSMSILTRKTPGAKHIERGNPEHSHEGHTDVPRISVEAAGERRAV
jgi:hypothetical protein